MYFDGNTHPYGPIDGRCLQRYNELGIISSRQFDLENTVAKVLELMVLKKPMEYSHQILVMV